MGYADSENVIKLKNEGANIKIIPENMLDKNLVFSVRESGNNKECILRHKLEDTFNPDTIKIYHLNSHAYISLLEEFIKSLEAAT